MVTYLPIRFKAKNPCQQQKSQIVDEAGWLSKLDKLRALHKSNERYLKKVLKLAEAGLTVARKNRQNILLHFLFALYVADIPEK